MFKSTGIWEMGLHTAHSKHLMHVKEENTHSHCKLHVHVVIYSCNVY